MRCRGFFRVHLPSWPLVFPRNDIDLMARSQIQRAWMRVTDVGRLGLQIMNGGAIALKACRLTCSRSYTAKWRLELVFWAAEKHASTAFAMPHPPTSHISFSFIATLRCDNPGLFDGKPKNFGLHCTALRPVSLSLPSKWALSSLFRYGTANV